MFYDVLQLVSIASLGVYAGAMLTEGGVLVPHWRSLPAADFFAWYRANDRRLLRFFGGITALAALCALATAIAAFAVGAPDRGSASIVAIAVLATVALFPLYFAKANARFSAASIAPADLPAELSRWATWHHVRTVLSVAAFAAALASR